MSSQNTRLLGLASVLLLAWGLLHVAGGLYNLALLASGGLLESLGVPPGETAGAPGLARAALGMSVVWSGCIIGLGLVACLLAHDGFRRGERRAWILTVAGLAPADMGATLLGLIAAPPMPYPVVLPLGVALFLGAAGLGAPGVWGKKQ